MVKRRTSLGGAVHALEGTLTPLVNALHSRLQSSTSTTEMTLDMRANVFCWLDEMYFGECKTDLLAWVAANCARGQQVAFTVWAMLRAEKSADDIMSQLYEYLSNWDEV